MKSRARSETVRQPSPSKLALEETASVVDPNGKYPVISTNLLREAATGGG